MIDPNIPSAVTAGSFGGELSEENDDWYDRPDHPLMNNVILTNVFEHLREKDFKESRFVCKTWNILTVPFTRKLFEVTIYGNHDLTKEHSIDNFVKVFSTNELGIPFARFKLGAFCTRDGVGQEFLKLCGETIKDIEFLKDNFRIEDVSELLKSTPKLEKLQIPKHLHSSSGKPKSLCVTKLFPEDSKPKLACLKTFTAICDNPKGRNEFCPTFLEELITAAENISCLNLCDSYKTDTDGDLIPSSFETLSLIEKLGREKSIQEISLIHKNSDQSDYVELLHKMAGKQNGLKLKRLQYDQSSEDGQPILQVISLFKDTLEYLTIDGGRFTSFMEFPMMPRLTFLLVSFCEDFNFRLRYVNLSKIFPVLKKLRLYHMAEDDEYEYDELDEFFPESEPCPTVEYLKLCGFTLKINGFNQMLSVFPNLIYFQVNIKDDGEEILRQIWTHMTQLESLVISGTIQRKDSMDSILTGIPGQVLHEIRGVVKRLEKMTTEVERRDKIFELRNQHSHHPFIGNLTKLRTLMLDLTGKKKSGGERCNWKYLTDLTGYLGFYSIKSLKALIVENCELSKNCCKILTKDMELEAWIFKTTDDDDIDILPPSI